MTDSNSSLNEVPALLDERRRYEGWLAALEARRESTPKHVFERVQADYRARLQRVGEELASHRQAIETERDHLQARVAQLSSEEQLKRDERAELELRTHVGELVGEEAERAFAGVDEVISRLAGERGGLSTRVAELQALLDEEAARPVQAPAPEPVAAVAPAAPEMPANEPAAPAVEAQKPAAAEARTEPVAAEPAARRESFDELAFLSSVVGKAEGGKPAPAAPPASAAPPAPAAPEGPLVERRNSEPLIAAAAGAAQERPMESLLAGLENSKPAAGERPLAANVSSNIPIVLRTAAVTEQVKTLKCNECGAMNYPTEWYCERCGAELAAL